MTHAMLTAARVAVCLPGETLSSHRRGKISSNVRDGVRRRCGRFAASTLARAQSESAGKQGGDGSRGEDSVEPVAGWAAEVSRRCHHGLVALAAGAAIAGSVAAPSPADAVTANQLLFLEAWRAVDKAYVDKTFNGTSWFRYRERAVKEQSMDSTEETYEAIRKMLTLLDDPFTRFLEPEKYESLSGSTMDASITGVGIEMAYASGKVGDVNDQIVVVTPASGGPADEAGVKPKDAIMAVDGDPTKGKSLYEVAEELGGPAGSKVQLTLAREGSKDTETITVTRRSYKLLPVSSKLCGPSAADGKQLGYVRLSSFNQLSAQKTKEAVKSLMADGAEELVLDMRNNSGGLFPGALDIAKAFVNKGTIVYIADSEGVRDVFELDGTAFAADIPLTLLVNSGTASASEVLTGALQDNGRAKVVGETTFGKGLIQTLVPLSDGSAVSVTVARYQTPSGADINKVGIQPDKPLPVDDVPTEPDGFCSLASSNADLKLFS